MWRIRFAAVCALSVVAVLVFFWARNSPPVWVEQSGLRAGNAVLMTVRFYDRPWWCTPWLAAVPGAAAMVLAFWPKRRPPWEKVVLPGPGPHRIWPLGEERSIEFEGPREYH